MSLTRVIDGTAIFLLITGILATAGCSQLITPQASPTPANTATPTTNPAPPPNPTSTPGGPITLRMWLPPGFDPNSDSPAATILQERLDEFVSRRPNARIEVRIKEMEGAGGLLDSLTSASTAAPLALPDLVALPRPMLETAALKGLLHPLDGLTEVMDEPDWYEYAREMSRLQDSTFGLPFAGDAIVLAYNTTSVPRPPLLLTETLTLNGPLAFPAADTRALFTLAEYRALGGALLDDQGRPTIEVTPLTNVLNYYQLAAASETIPFWVTQYQSDAQVWQAFEEGQATMVATWASYYLNEAQPDMSVSILPTLQGITYTLASGWVWALVSPNHEHHELAAQLAEFLSESDFLQRWDSALGYLPTRSGALAGWRNPSQQAFASVVVESAHLIPPADVLTSLGPPLSNAGVEVLKMSSDPITAAQEAAASLNAP